MYLILDLREFPYEVPPVVAMEDDPSKPMIFSEEAEAEEYAEALIGTYQIIALEE